MARPSSLSSFYFSDGGRPVCAMHSTTENEERKKKTICIAWLAHKYARKSAPPNQAPENALNMQSVLIHHKNVSPTYHAIALPAWPGHHIMCTSFVVNVPTTNT